MKMILKNTLLVMLIILSIYQTAMLWFDYPSDRNFFYSIIDDDSSLIVDESVMNYELFYPEEVAVYEGTQGTYQKKKLNENDDFTLVSDGILLIQTSFNIGVPLEGAIFAKQLWENPHLLFKMPYTITEEILVNNLSVESTWIKPDMNIDYIYVYPADFTDNYVTVYFADESLTTKFGCKIPLDQSKQLNASLKRYLEEADDTEDLVYFSAKKSMLPIFLNERLLPNKDQTYDLLENLYGDIYFYEGEKRDSQQIKNFVDYFFLNPENIWKIENPEEVRYGDSEAIVSYDSKGLFRYELLEELTGKKVNLNKAYETYKIFLGKDTTLSQIEYRLSEYKVFEEEIVFYFDYYHRGVPIIFDSIEQDYGIETPMVLTVRGNTVVEYQRLLWRSQEVVIQGNQFEVEFQKPIDDLLSDYPDTDIKIADMYLAYHISDLVDGAYLQWVVELDNGKRGFYELE